MTAARGASVSRALTKVLDAVHARVDKVRNVADGYSAQCPAHDDNSPSLAIRYAEGRQGESGGRVLLHCHAGCEPTDVLAALSLDWADLYDADLPQGGRGVLRDFPYTTGSGRWLGSVQRTESSRGKLFLPVTSAAGGKLVRKSSPELKSHPYRLPDVVAAIDEGRKVYVVEGERDADTLAGQGYSATCNAGGAGKWTDDHAAWLRGADVIICRDADEPGHDHARKVAATLAGVAARIRMVEPAEGSKDVTDHLLAGHSVADLRSVELEAVETAEGDEDVPDERVTWAPVDLTGYLDGTYQPQAPALMQRSDGPALLYVGLVHWFHGESESGKSWCAQVAAARVLMAGHRVLYLDHESDPGAITARLLALGVPASVQLEQLHYVHPEVGWRREPEAFAALLETGYQLAVVDGVTDALGLDGASSMDTDEVARWVRSMPRAIARHTGAAVVCIDHVTKDADSRGRFAIGSQAKLAGLDGAAYAVEPITPLGRGLRGELKLRVVKDRPGSVRAHGGRYRSSDRSQEIARLVLDATDPEHLVEQVEPPEATATDSSGASGSAPQPFRPTTLMERASVYIEGHPDTTQSEVVKSVSGRGEYLRQAIEVLVSEGWVSRETSTRGSSTTHRLSSTTRFREAEDLAGTASPSLEGGTRGTRPIEESFDRVPDAAGTRRDAVPPAKTSGRGEPSATVSQDHGLGGHPKDHFEDHCQRCDKPTQFGLIGGKCRRCAYPSGSNRPEEDQ